MSEVAHETAPDKLTDKEAQDKAVAMGSPIVIPEVFKGWLMDFAARTASDFFMKQAAIYREGRFQQADNGSNTDPTTFNNASFASVPTFPGPFIRHISDGSYLFFFGFFNNTANVKVEAALAINGVLANGEADPTTKEAQTLTQGHAANVAQFDIKGNNDNTVEVWFRTAASAEIHQRFLCCVKVFSPA